MLQNVSYDVCMGYGCENDFVNLWIYYKEEIQCECVYEHDLKLASLLC